MTLIRKPTQYCPAFYSTYSSTHFRQHHYKIECLPYQYYIEKKFGCDLFLFFCRAIISVSISFLFLYLHEHVFKGEDAAGFEIQ